MIVKQDDERHFTLPLGERSFSHRVILPGRDPSRVKVTKFVGFKGEKFQGVSYTVDETVTITRGGVRITQNGSTWDLWTGGTYYVPARETYSIEVIEKVVAVCVFSQAADGTTPEDEADPKR